MNTDDFLVSSGSCLRTGASPEEPLDRRRADCQLLYGRFVSSLVLGFNKCVKQRAKRQNIFSVCILSHQIVSKENYLLPKETKSKLKIYVLHYVLLLRGLCTCFIQIKLNIWTGWVIFITSLLRCDFGDHCINH